ncbi:hypothetical protein NL676_035108 [Syzygium grande]|nr:hypothetical protein NL676_035108 [Syzygium grande]
MSSCPRQCCWKSRIRSTSLPLWSYATSARTPPASSRPYGWWTHPTTIDFGATKPSSASTNQETSALNSSDEPNDEMGRFGRRLSDYGFSVAERVRKKREMRV